jgi:cytidylate kinase
MHFLISGIPASGKSTFCKWLAEEKGFLHLDVEKTGVLDRYGLATAWATLFDASVTAAPFIEALDSPGREDQAGSHSARENLLPAVQCKSSKWS